MLPTSEVLKAAEDQRDELLKQDRWIAAYKDAKAQEPLLVGGRPGRDYYIVEFRKEGGTTGLMRVNALAGRVGAFTGIQKAGTSLYRFYRPTEIPDIVARQPDVFP